MTDKTKAQATAANVKEKVATAIDATKTETGKQVNDHPMAVLIGGLAVGLVAGALLPKTQRERQVLGPLGKRITETAGAAAAAARDVGRQELSALTPDKASAKARAGSIVEHVLLAAKEAGREAAKKTA